MTLFVYGVVLFVLRAFYFKFSFRSFEVYYFTTELVYLPFFQTYLEAAKTKFKKDYKSLNASKITTTVGLNIGQVDVAGIRINFWDLGGQEDLQSLWDKVR